MNRWISSLLTTLYDYWMIGERLCSITCSIGTDALQKISYAIKLVAAQLLSEKSGSYINQSTKYAGVSFSPFITQIGGVSTSTHQLERMRQQQHYVNPYSNYQPPATYFQPQASSMGHTPLILSTDALFNPSSIEAPQGQLTHQQVHEQAMKYAASIGVVSIAVPPISETDKSTLSNRHCTMKFGVPEKLTGALIGRGGAGLKEIMGASGALAKVAQKGDFIPGTENRLITLTGSHSAVQTAQYHISSILSKEAKRRNIDAFVIDATIEFK